MFGMAVKIYVPIPLPLPLPPPPLHSPFFALLPFPHFHSSSLPCMNVDERYHKTMMLKLNTRSSYVVLIYLVKYVKNLSKLEHVCMDLNIL